MHACALYVATRPHVHCILGHMACELDSLGLFLTCIVVGVWRMPLVSLSLMLLVARSRVLNMIMQDDCVFKMIVELASLDTGVAARALSHVIENEDAEIRQQQDRQDAAVGTARQRRNSRGKAPASRLPPPHDTSVSRARRTPKLINSAFT